MVDVAVPLTFEAQDAQKVAFVVSVQVGNAKPLDFLLDTGSAGLRILPGFVADSAFASISSTETQATFGTGQVFSGVVATANVGIGSVSTPEPIPVMLVQNVGCTPDKPQCPANLFGLAGILGVGLRNSKTTSLGSPLAQLTGSPSFVIEAPPYVDPGTATGTLLLGPTAAEIASFRTLPLQQDPSRSLLPNGIPAWIDDTLPVCVNDTTADQQWCAGAIFDTGTPALLVEVPDSTSAESNLPANDAVDVTIGSNGAIGQYSFVVSSMPEAGQDLVEIEPAPALADGGAPSASINLGIGVFFENDVLFDARDGLIGLRPH